MFPVIAAVSSASASSHQRERARLIATHDVHGQQAAQQAQPTRSATSIPFLPTISTSTSSTFRCFFTYPFAAVAFLLVTALWIYLMWYPLFGKQILVSNAMQIDIPAESHHHHENGGVIVGREHDIAEVSTWTALSHHHHQSLQPRSPDPTSNRTAAPPFSCYGVHSQRGRRRYMEDTYAVYLNHQLHYSSAIHKHLMSVDTEEGESDVVSPWALFGVFDGHGGAIAAEYAASYLLPTLHSSLLHHHTLDDAADSEPIETLFKNIFREMDEEFLEAIARPEGLVDGTTALVAGIHYREGRGGEPDQDSSKGSFQLVVANLGDCRAILIRSPFIPFQTTPSSTSSSSDPSTQPSSPSSFITPSLKIRSMPLSTDHKPHTPSEKSYIESQGGFVTTDRWGDGRVQGVLAVSRALGDRPLKPFVNNQPEIRFVDLANLHFPSSSSSSEEEGQDTASSSCSPSSDPIDSSINNEHEGCGSDAAGPTSSSSSSDLLLLASDGFWDVFTNEQAADAVVQFLHAHAMQSDTTSATAEDLHSHTVLSSLSRHLVKDAYLRGSMDNISVLVIDVACIKQWLRQSINSAHSQLKP